MNKESEKNSNGWLARSNDFAASALRPPRRIKPSEWAEQNFVLPRTVSAESGRLRLSRTPYLRGIIDAAIEPGVEEVVFVKPTQVGGTTAQEILIGYAIDIDPGPALIVKPSEQATEDCVKERLRPLIEGTPALSRYMSGRPHDNTLSSIKLASMPVYLAWAGSPQSLASRPIRWLFPDEVDKYPPFAGREADPISLAKERTATYLHRKKIFITSTPTTREGAIWLAFEGCGDKRYFFVPCPHCQKFQRLVWTQLKWPRLDISDRVKRADEIEQCHLAWYECVHCKGRIEESHKPKMLEHGQWVSEGQAIDDLGVISGDRPISKRVGFHLSSLYSPWRKFYEMAAEFIRAEGDIAATMNFRNSRLAEPFEVQVSKREPSAIRAKAEQAKTFGTAGSIRIMPDWAVILLATCDVQKDHVYWSVSAWGYELKSKRLLVGVCATLDEAYRHVFAPDIPYRTAGGAAVSAAYMIVDSGFRKDEVTDFAKRDPTRVHLSKGMSTYFGPIAEQKVEKASGVVVWNINTMQSKDRLHWLISHEDPAQWQVYPEIGDEFCAQMASEHKVINPQTKQMEWKQKSSGAANHDWDNEAVACAVASALGAAMPKPKEPEHVEPVAVVPAMRPSWIPERPENWMKR